MEIFTYSNVLFYKIRILHIQKTYFLKWGLYIFICPILQSGEFT
jgi:hypothetical protein